MTTHHWRKRKRKQAEDKQLGESVSGEMSQNDNTALVMLSEAKESACRVVYQSGYSTMINV